jgi:hypothetical protein
LLQFLTDSRIFQAVKQGGADLESLMKELEKYPKFEAAAFELIYNAYSLALRCCKSAFEDRKTPIQMCYNLNVSPLHEPTMIHEFNGACSAPTSSRRLTPLCRVENL